MRRLIPLAILAIAVAATLSISFEQANAAPPNCELVCNCNHLTTAHFIRVGATCPKAQTNAANAATAAAVCPSGQTSCGPVTVYVTFSCFPHPVSGQIAAEAFATYSCQECHLECDPPDKPPLIP